MPPEMRAAVRNLISLVRGMQQTGQEIPPALQQRLTSLFNRIAERAQLPFHREIAPPPTANSNLLWILSGGNPEVFKNYVQTFPDPSLRRLLTNPEMFQSTVDRLQREMPQGFPGEVDGVPQSSLASSNVYGMRYNPQTKKLFVKFNGKTNRDDGPVYEYDNVPPQIAALAQAGAIPAKTKGQNRFGRWWPSKMPSAGASVSALIKNGGFSYARVA